MKLKKQLPLPRDPAGAQRVLTGSNMFFTFVHEPFAVQNLRHLKSGWRTSCGPPTTPTRPAPSPILENSLKSSSRVSPKTNVQRSYAAMPLVSGTSKSHPSDTVIKTILGPHCINVQDRGRSASFDQEPIGRLHGLPPRGCVACVSVLAGFMSERATPVAFGSTSCVGGGGTSAASTGS